MAIAELSRAGDLVAPTDSAPPLSGPSVSHVGRSMVRGVFAGILLLAAAGLVWRRTEMVEATRTLREVDLRAILAATILLVVGLINRGALHRSAHAVLGMPVRLGPMIRISAAVSAVNKVVRSGGAIGVALFVGDGCRGGRPPERVVIAYLLSSLASQMALALLLGPAVVLAHRSGQLPDVWLAAGLGALLYMLVLLAAAFCASRSTRLVTRVRKIAAGVARRTRDNTSARSESGVDLAALLRKEPRNAGRLLVHAVIDKMIGLLTLLVTLVGLGATFEPGVALVSYCVALVSSMIALVPGGIGAVEVSLGAALTAAEIPGPVANSGVLAFRFFDLWMPVLIGIPTLRGLNRLWSATARTVDHGDDDRPRPVLAGLDGTHGNRRSGLVDRTDHRGLAQ